MLHEFHLTKEVSCKIAKLTKQISLFARVGTASISQYLAKRSSMQTRELVQAAQISVRVLSGLTGASARADAQIVKKVCLHYLNAAFLNKLYTCK